MKKLFSFLLAMCALGLSGCGHSHTWSEATCLSPKTCSTCGEQDGTALGHNWEVATCTTPKICTICNITEGLPLGHNWTNETCTRPKTCVICSATEGNALGHSWEDATCTTPRTCTICGETDGTALGHDTPMLTCTNDGECTRCAMVVDAPGHSLTDATCTEPAKCEFCGEYSGEALGHTSDNGICDRCGMESYSTVTGYGDDVITDIAVGDGIYRVHFTHSGRSNFIVKSYDAEGEKELLINEIGNYNGYVLLLGDSPFAFEITAGGSWSYTIESLGVISDTSFVGRGDYVTGLCSLTSGAWKFTHSGDSNFVVKMYSSDGRDLLVNEIGYYNGKKMLTIPRGSYAFFEIIADGNWTISQA